MIKSTLLVAISSVTLSAIAFSMPYGIGCATDIDTEGAVGVGDVLALIDRWGTTDPTADCNGDGIVTCPHKL